MGYQAMEELKDMVCRELDEIAEKGQLSAGDLDAVHKLVVTKEKLLRIEELEEDLGYSQDGEWHADGNYSRDGSMQSYGRGGRSGGRNSYGRHYVRGHYSRRGYSMAEAKEDIRGRMQSMMDDPNISQADRASLQRAMDMIR